MKEFLTVLTAILVLFVIALIVSKRFRRKTFRFCKKITRKIFRFFTKPIGNLLSRIFNYEPKRKSKGYEHDYGDTFWHPFNSPEARGEMGERTVTKALGNNIDGVRYLINDITISDGNGQSSQIDHVFINENGIWVIETKNYSGMILGKENDEKWTQVLAYGNEKNSFYNPIKQNNTHIYRLSKLLSPQIKLHSIVAFASLDADLSNISARGICYAHMLPKYVAQKTDVTLTSEQIVHYKNCLQELKDKNVISLKEHVANIHKMQENLENDICPRCGGKLREVEGKYGTFKGCSNYPKCTFTLKSR